MDNINAMDSVWFYLGCAAIGLILLWWIVRSESNPLPGPLPLIGKLPAKPVLAFHSSVLQTETIYSFLWSMPEEFGPYIFTYVLKAPDGSIIANGSNYTEYAFTIPTPVVLGRYTFSIAATNPVGGRTGPVAEAEGLVY